MTSDVLAIAFYLFCAAICYVCVYGQVEELIEIHRVKKIARTVRKFRRER